jgi:hypothetical protein
MVEISYKNGDTYTVYDFASMDGSSNVSITRHKYINNKYAGANGATAKTVAIEGFSVTDCSDLLELLETVSPYFW